MPSTGLSTCVIFARREIIEDENLRKEFQQMRTNQQLKDEMLKILSQSKFEMGLGKCQQQLEELLAQLGEETPAQQPTYQQNINNDNARIGQQINIQEWTSGELIFNNKKKKRRKP